MEMSVITLLTAFGAGSVITAFVQWYFNSRTANQTRNFNEKKEAYVGLLEAYREVAIEGTDSAAKNFAYWQLRCELVSPQSLRSAIRQLIESPPNTTARQEAHDLLQNEMRLDLGVTDR